MRRKSRVYSGQTHTKRRVQLATQISDKVIYNMTYLCSYIQIFLIIQ